MAKDPSYRLHRPSGRAVVTLNGRDHYLGKHGTKESKNAYKRLLTEWKAANRSTSFGVGPSVTLAMLCADYLEHCEGHYPGGKHNSETNQTRLAVKYLSAYYGELVTDFGPLKLKAVRQLMLEAVNQNNGKPLTRQYINKMVDRIVRMFRWGAENELLPIAVYQALANVRGLQKGRSAAPESPPVKPVADEVVEASIKQCTPVVADMIRVQWLTGMRPGEVCCLTPGMIDRSGEVWIAVLPEHKSAWRGQDRAIFIGPQAQQILLPYLLRAADSAIFSPMEAERQRREKLRANRVTPLNCGNREGTNRRPKPMTQPGAEYRTSTYSNAIRYATLKAYPIAKGATEAEIRAHKAKWLWSPNQLRHSAATKIRKLHGIDLARVMLGHTSATTTEIYAEMDREKGVQLALAIG